ncbi:MAG: carbohydrate binding domain-containing protein [Armatimonadota bacterium]
MAVCSSGAGLTTCAAQPYTRFLEAEDFVLAPDGFRQGINRAASYRGERFVYRILKEVPEQPLRMSRQLETDLPPGDYRVFVRAYAEGEPESRVIHVRLNDAQADVPFPTEDLRRGKHNWVGASLRTQRPGRDLDVAVTMKEAGRIIIDAVMVTSDPACTLVEHSKIVREEPTSSGPGVVPEPGGNLLSNASFELGTDSWHTAYQSRFALEASDVVAERPVHGEKCLRLALRRDTRQWDLYRTQGGIVALPCDVLPGRKYSVSAYVRASDAVTASVFVALFSAAGERQSKQIARQELEPGADWVRLSGSFDVPEGIVRCEAGVDFSHDAPATVFLDAVQLELGEVTDFKPAHPVEIGASCTRLGRLFYADEPVSFHWTLWAEGPSTKPASLSYRIYDYRDRVVREGRERFGTGRRGAQQKPFTARFPEGAYRLVYGQEGRARARQLSFCVVPRPLPADQDCAIGTYLTLKPQPLQLADRLGLRWMCSLSASGHIASWGLVQPESRDRFVFHDDDVRAAREHHVKILANVHTSSYRMPQWALLDAPPPGEPCVLHRGTQRYFRLSDWEHFVFNLVSRYKHTIRHWLVIDEPYSQYSAEDYGRLLEASYRAAKRADPECTVFAHGGYSDAWMPQVIDTVGPGVFDGVYDYMREQRHADVLADICRTHNKLLWAVEYGGVPTIYSPPQEVSLAGSQSRLPVIENMNRYLHSAIRSLCWAPAAKYMRYDARFPGHVPPTNYMTLWEYDGGVKPLAAALANLNRLASGAVGDGEVTAHPALRCFLFRGVGEYTVALWSADGEVLHVDLPPPLRDAEAVDVMGRGVTGSRRGGSRRIALDMLPLYLEVEGASRQQIVDAIGASSVRRALPLDMRIVAAEGERALALEATLTNRTDGPVSVTCDLMPRSRYALRDPWTPAATIDRLAAGASETARFALNYYPGDVIEDKPIELCAAGPGIGFCRSKVLYYVRLPKADAVVCDGDLTEWALDDPTAGPRRLTIVGFRRNRPADRQEARLDAWMAWSDAGLHLALRLSDAHHHLSTDPHGRQPDQSGQVVRAYLAAPSSPGAIVTALIVPARDAPLRATASGKDGEHKLDAGAQWAGGAWTAEVLLPFSLLPGFRPTPGGDLLFDLALSDWNEDRLLGEVVWAGRDAPPGDPAGFGQVVLH